MISFKQLDWDNLEECLSLEVNEDQKKYVASNMYSLAQSYVALLNDKLPAMTYAIYHDVTMVGFIMMYHDTAEENEYGDEEAYGILRFMIDRKYQGKGLGKKAFEKALDYLKCYPQGDAQAIYISYDPANTIADQLYKQYGFKGIGKTDEDGDSVVKLDL
ncbi:diamine N-acetyltransferase [Alkalihalobacillus xiaoxiensis]|uniref:Diamine N-acetyltransferase n=1 Tax=Shouchella xiaoxiensis TaxID=766895 RepID=A0ABS2SYX7_9BACI|nr:GNAT family N-acetyltransferase [Shouchella xiaoxiensis]MBM7839427.1 diamine N-acetyltransferase [Shouchella xiaoxiensis]